MSALQQVNLFPVAIQAERQLVRFTTMLTAWGLIILFLGSLQLWGWFQTQETRQHLADMELQQVKVLQQLNALRDSTPRNNQARLEDRINASRVRVAQQRQLLQIMKGQSIGNTNGFSAHLISLAEQHVGGLSLDQFDLMDGGDYVEISGWTYKPELLPDYIQRLQTEDSFRETRFGDLTIERVAQQRTDALRFTLGDAGKGDS